MSRIHEALKKAEEERSAVPTAEPPRKLQREAAVATPVWPERSLSVPSEVAAEQKDGCLSDGALAFRRVAGALCASAMAHGS